MKAHFEMMAAYNQWANRRLFDAARAMPEADYRRDAGVFFKSMHGTLNHLYVADVIWMSRFRADPVPNWSLDHIVHDRLEDLWPRRTALDTDILGFVLSLPEERFAKTFTYRTIVQPQDITQQLSPALAHFFNHQTHHRGHCHAILTRLTGDAPSLDLLIYQRET